MQTPEPVAQTPLANPGTLDRYAALAALAAMETAANQLRQALGLPPRPLVPQDRPAD